MIHCGKLQAKNPSKTTTTKKRHFSKVHFFSPFCSAHNGSVYFIMEISKIFSLSFILITIHTKGMRLTHTGMAATLREPYLSWRIMVSNLITCFYQTILQENAYAYVKFFLDMLTRRTKKLRKQQQQNINL